MHYYIPKEMDFYSQTWFFYISYHKSLTSMLDKAEKVTDYSLAIVLHLGFGGAHRACLF